MAPRGLSANDKRIKLLEIFHESKDFFQLKELEKLGPKLKGIVSQSVKEVLQGLVDDGLVQGDKIGSSNFFWSFPSERGAMMINRLNAAKESRQNLQVQVQETHQHLEAEKGLREETEERAAALLRLSSARAKLSDLEKELSQYGSCNPATIETKRRASTLAHEAAIRWTDNVALLFTHFTRQYCLDPSELRQYLGIVEDFEDIC